MFSKHRISEKLIWSFPNSEIENFPLLVCTIIQYEKSISSSFQSLYMKCSATDRRFLSTLIRSTLLNWVSLIKIIKFPDRFFRMLHCQFNTFLPSTFLFVLWNVPFLPVLWVNKIISEQIFRNNKGKYNTKAIIDVGKNSSCKYPFVFSNTDVKIAGWIIAKKLLG